MASKPTQRTLKQLRDEGWTCAIVERWNQFANVRQDLFGFADILAINGRRIAAVQCTDGSSHANRREKILASDAARLWLESGGEILLASWRKAKVKRGGKAVRWKPRWEPICLLDFDQAGNIAESVPDAASNATKSKTRLVEPAADAGR